MKNVKAEQRRGHDAVGNAVGTEPSSWTSLPAWAGIVSPVLFTATFLVQESFRTAEYNPIAEPVSALEAGPNGWVQQVNFVVFGLLTIAFAVGLSRGVQPTRAGILGPGFIVLSGIGLLLAAIFPLSEDAAGITYDPGGHVVAGLTFFLSSAVGLIMVSRRSARDPRWRGIATYTLASGVLALAGFAPLHEWAGPAQRVLILAVVFPCRLVLSFRLLRVAKGWR